MKQISILIVTLNILLSGTVLPPNDLSKKYIENQKVRANISAQSDTDYSYIGIGCPFLLHIASAHKDLYYPELYGYELSISILASRFSYYRQIKCNSYIDLGLKPGILLINILSKGVVSYTLPTSIGVSFGAPLNIHFTKRIHLCINPSLNYYPLTYVLGHSNRIKFNRSNFKSMIEYTLVCRL